MVTDTIADLITRIRNAYLAGHDSLVCPYARVSGDILDILKANEYITSFTKQKNAAGFEEFNIILIESPVRRFTFTRVSKPGQRIYKGYRDLRKVRQGLGISIVSTPQGIVTGQEAFKKKLGGEVMVHVY